MYENIWLRYIRFFNKDCKKGTKWKVDKKDNEQGNFIAESFVFATSKKLK